MQPRLSRYALVSLLLVACGHDDTSPPVTEAPPPVADAAPPVADAPPPAVTVPGTTTPIADFGPLEMDWSSTTPLEFLDSLTSDPSYSFTIWNKPTMDWFDEEQLQGLFDRLNSPAPARSVVSALSSRMPHGVSTEGREAAYLLTGYREGYYPPSIGSLIMFEPDYDDIRAWWKSR